MVFTRRHWDKMLLALFILIYFVTFSTLAILRHDAFASGLDLGNMDQTVWNTLHGRIFSLSTDGATVSRFFHHSDIILIFFAPLYLLWSSPHVLNIVESLALALGVIPTYLIARHVLKDSKIALILSLMYVLSPLLEWADIFDFHAVTLSIPLILSAFYCILTRKWKWYGLFITIALLTKEEISLQIALLGLIIFFFFKERTIGAVTFVVSTIWFVLMMLVVIPHFSPSGEHWALAWYSQDGIASIINRVLQDPRVLEYYLLVLKSYGFLPILGFPWLILSLPDLAINVLSSHTETISIKYHYVSGLIPGLILGSIYGVRYLEIFLSKFVKQQRYKKVSLYFFVFCSLFIVLRVNYHHSPLPVAPACWCVSYKVSPEDREFEKILQNIPVYASVTASTEIHAHVTHREESYLLPYATDSADFIALIDQNRVIDNYGPKPYEIDLINKLNSEGKYELQNHIGHFYLYKKVRAIISP